MKIYAAVQKKRLLGRACSLLLGHGRSADGHDIRTIRCLGTARISRVTWGFNPPNGIPRVTRARPRTPAKTAVFQEIKGKGHAARGARKPESPKARLVLTEARSRHDDPVWCLPPNAPAVFDLVDWHRTRVLSRRREIDGWPDDLERCEPADRVGA